MEDFTQIVLDHSLEYAKELLEDTGEFYPFAAYVDMAGQIHPLEFEIEDKKNMPNNGKVIEALDLYCTEQFEQRKLKAYGITYESGVQLTEEEETINAITIDIKPLENLEAPVFYFPFESKDGNMSYGEPFAVKRD